MYGTAGRRLGGRGFSRGRPSAAGKSGLTCRLARTMNSLWRPVTMFGCATEVIRESELGRLLECIRGKKERVSGGQPRGRPTDVVCCHFNPYIVLWSRPSPRRPSSSEIMRRPAGRTATYFIQSIAKISPSMAVSLNKSLH